MTVVALNVRPANHLEAELGTLLNSFCGSASRFAPVEPWMLTDTGRLPQALGRRRDHFLWLAAVKWNYQVKVVAWVMGVSVRTVSRAAKRHRAGVLGDAGWALECRRVEHELGIQP